MPKSISLAKLSRDFQTGKIEYSFIDARPSKKKLNFISYFTPETLVAHRIFDQIAC